MRLAESVRAHWFLALTSVAFVGTTVAVVATCPDKEKKIIRVEKSKSMKKIGKCRGEMKKQAKPVEPAKEPETWGSVHRDIFWTARGDLFRCTQAAPKGVNYRTVLNIGRDGAVKDVEVKAASNDLRNVDLRTVACIEKAVTKLQFPATDTAQRLSFNVTNDK